MATLQISGLHLNGMVVSPMWHLLYFFPLPQGTGRFG
jgi:hypothetical protein